MEITEAVQALTQPAIDLPELSPAQQLELFDDGQLDLFATADASSDNAQAD